MRRLASFILLSIIALAASGIASAQGPPIPLHNAPAWQASYWNNGNMSGVAALIREESDINWNWGNGSPAVEIGPDGFSARWNRYLDFAAGRYRFTVTSDDGVRVYVDNQLIINQWHDHAATTYSADVNVSAGHHQIQVEYFENGGQALIQFGWQRLDPGPAPNMWRAEYFNNMSLQGAPAVVRDEAAIDYDWQSLGPLSNIGPDHFSARWRRSVNFAAGSYRFSVTADDGARLWVNGHLLVDQWHEQAATTYTADIYLPAGSAELVMEYYEQGGGAVARLSWSPASGTSTDPVPTAGTVTVDDTDAGFVTGGSPGGWRGAGEGQGGHLTWTKNNTIVRPNYNWARWYADLEDARYEVFVYIPWRYTTTTAAHYWVRHRDGYALRIIDQNANGDRWVSLGTFDFRGDGSDFVSLNDVTGETRLSRLIAFDAVRWEPR